MILHQNTLLSEALLKEKFVCDLEACKGACCVRGQSGAPLEVEEARTLSQIYNQVQPYLPQSGIHAIEKQGKFVKDEDGGQSTPLVENKECAYTVFEKGIAQCGIELAWKAGKTNFQKPISCHLYPIRITPLAEIDALNYEEWDICKAACSLGKKLNVPVFRFVKDALIRKYGQAYYDTLEEIYESRKA